MTEKDVEQQFCQFLIGSKKFPTTSLLRQAPSYAFGNGGTLRVDLLLLDVKIGEYIGVVEFKDGISPPVKASAARLLQRYREIIKSPDLPSYLVHPYDEKDFQIQVFSEGVWLAITKDEFPEFETLSAKKKIEEKVIEKEVQERLVVESRNKVERTKSFSLLTLASLIVGVLTTVLVFNQSVHFGEGADTRRFEMQVSRLNVMEDSLSVLLQKQRHPSSVVDTLHIVDSSGTFHILEKRLAIIEKGLVDEPDEVLAIANVNSDLKVLREEVHGQEKLLSARYENLLTRIEWLNALVIGMVVSLFAAAIGFVITSYSDKRKANKAP